MSFDIVYKQKLWGHFDHQRSGPGSTVESASNVIEFLGKVIEKYQIRSMVDVSCGDMNWQARLLENHPEIQFTGIDISQTAIASNIIKYQGKGQDAKVHFICADASMDLIPEADLIICRHTMMHLKSFTVLRILERMKHSAKYMCLTSHDVLSNPDDHERQLIGQDTYGAYKWVPTNLCISPFHLPAPLERVQDNNDVHEHFMLWRLR